MNTKVLWIGNTGFRSLIDIMKNLIVGMMVFLSLGLNLLAGPARVMTEKDLPILKVPSRVTFDKGPSYHTRVDPVEVNKDGVRYYAMDKKKGVWVVFMADHDGTLRGFRIVKEDQSVFAWGKVEDNSTVNTVQTNIEAWKRLYEKQVRFNRPVKFSEY